MARNRWHRTPSYWGLWCFLILASPVLGNSASAYAERTQWVMNVLSYVDWPDSSISEQTAPLHFCLGPSPQRPLGLSQLHGFAGKAVRQRPLVLFSIDQPAQISRCHVVLLDHSLDDQLYNWAAWAVESGTLLIADTPNALEKGAMIGLKPRLNPADPLERIRFEVDADQLKRAKIALSSAVLRLAQRVHMAPPRQPERAPASK